MFNTFAVPLVSILTEQQKVGTRPRGFCMSVIPKRHNVGTAYQRGNTLNPVPQNCQAK